MTGLASPAPHVVMSTIALAMGANRRGRVGQNKRLLTPLVQVVFEIVIVVNPVGKKETRRWNE